MSWSANEFIIVQQKVISGESHSWADYNEDIKTFLLLPSLTLLLETFSRNYSVYVIPKKSKQINATQRALIKLFSCLHFLDWFDLRSENKIHVYISFEDKE